MKRCAHSFGKRTLWVLLGIVAVLLFVRVFLIGLYFVDSGSMEPTLHGSSAEGEYVAVSYGGGRNLRRFDLVVLFPGGGESEPRVKRVGGLTGEKILVRGGDLWIDDKLLPPRAPRPPLIPIFDDASTDIQSWFRFTDSWLIAKDELVLDATDVDEGAGYGLLYMRHPLKDHYRGADGELVLGGEVVGDAAIRVDVRFDLPAATVRVGLSEQGDVFELHIVPLGERAILRLQKRNARGLQIFEELEVEWVSGFHQLFFCNRDDTLFVEIDGEQKLSVSYSGNTFLPSDHGKRGLSFPTERVFFGGHSGRATFRSVRVLRDQHYTPRGEFGIDKEVQLGPAEIFVLGDNSRESRDGRDWGPTPLSEVLGRPIGVVWPPRSARLLERPAAE